MAFVDGIYNIRNVGTNLMLDLKDNKPYEGATIWGKPADETVAQEWVCKYQSEPGTNYTSISMQSNNVSCEGLGFFAAEKQESGALIKYTRYTWLVECTSFGRNHYFNVRFTRGDKNLMLSIPDKDRLLKLVDANPGDPDQQWDLIWVRDIVPS